MGSVKDLIIDDSPAGRLYEAPTARDFGRGAWNVKGTYSVGDLKKLMPDSTIKYKPETLTMQVGLFFEWFHSKYFGSSTCYLGLMNHDGKVTDAQTLLDKGETSNVVVMKLAHVPDTYSKGDLAAYRHALQTGELQCGVADVESIFRKGFPLGSSTFERIFQAVDLGEVYEILATYDEVVSGLDRVRELVERNGLEAYPQLVKVMKSANLGTRIPNPGFVLKDFTYDSTTKFEKAGDRAITKEEERALSGLDDDGYELWTNVTFPNLARAQIDFTSERGILNIDGKAECVTFGGKPVITDFACTVDENRLMIEVPVDGVNYAIPTNKEIQRAIFRKHGVYAAKAEAIRRAEKAGNKDRWHEYFTQVANEKDIDLQGVSDYSCQLMSSAIGEVANRTFGKRVFDVPSVDTWVKDFLPYASRIEHQE